MVERREVLIVYNRNRILIVYKVSLHIKYQCFKKQSRDATDNPNKHLPIKTLEKGVNRTVPMKGINGVVLSSLLLTYFEHILNILHTFSYCFYC